ncbi:MAG: 4a-hydroxytetrahydrobiopterin dehydratase [Patescibacteria group bacterium]|nr:4a-hydroxytetrahydrobiopterin dehydratase [Patescibacteria group bacterium]
MNKVKGWLEKGSTLVKEFKFNDFAAAVEFVNKVGEFAEQMNHHPDILIHSYNNVRITLTTHSEGKITEKDIKLAKMIDEIE